MLTIFIGVFFIGCVAFGIWEHRNGLRCSKTNPYTYYCKRCGQVFDTFGIMGCSHHDTLEPVGGIMDKACRCVRPYRNEAWFKEA